MTTSASAPRIRRSSDRDKTPSPIQELNVLRGQASLVRQQLSNFQNEFGHGEGLLGSEIDALSAVLSRTDLPEYYRVAVVGHFKVGKSSFINKVCGVPNLASVSTNPETAAITTFRYADEARAEIHFLSRTAWEEVAQRHARNPADPQGRRYQRFHDKVAERRKKNAQDRSDGKPAVDQDYGALLDAYITEACEPVVLRCKDWRDPKQQKEFKAQIKSFVSSMDPLHCLVERVELFAPIPLLKERIELIDTPGLGDTDLYRVQATEQIVDDVDGIVFLTQSGSSYSQSDKDFLMAQLRRRRLRSLKMVITKIDMTYDAALRQAEEDEEAPPTLEEHKEEQEKRVKGALQDTLAEIMSGSGVAHDEQEYYKGLLEDIEIFFVSAKWHGEGKTDDEKRFNTARSGIPELQQVVSGMFRNADMVRDYAQQVSQALAGVLESVQMNLKQYRKLYDDVSKDTKVELQLQETQRLVMERLERFLKKSDLRVQNARMIDSFDSQEISSRVKEISTTVQRIIDELERRDLAGHWKVRRGGGWLNLYNFSINVSNQVFGPFESLIMKFQGRMVARAQASQDGIDRFVEDIKAMSTEHREFRSETLELIEFIRGRLRIDKKDMEAILRTEMEAISERLNGFMDEDMQEKIEEAKLQVAYASGVGTTQMQNVAIRKFYDDFAHIVRPGLESYLNRQLEHYLDIVEDKLGTTREKLKAEIDSSLTEQSERIAAIKNAEDLRGAQRSIDALSRLEGEIRQTVQGASAA